MLSKINLIEITDLDRVRTRQQKIHYFSILNFLFYTLTFVSEKLLLWTTSSSHYWSSLVPSEVHVHSLQEKREGYQETSTTFILLLFFCVQLIMTQQKLIR